MAQVHYHQTSELIIPAGTTLLPIPRFTGIPGQERTSHFEYKLVTGVFAAPNVLETKRLRILYASTFLAGPALDWYIDLLFKNACHYVGPENAWRRQQGWPELSFGRRTPWALLQCTFLINELSTFLKFVAALAARFPDAGK